MNWRKLLGRPETIWFPLLLMILLADCRRPVRLPPEEQEPDRNERMEKVNEFLVVKDEEVIRNFIGRMGWEMERTESGLWYMIMERGDGPAVTPGKTVAYDYRISLLDGTLCYSSEEDGAKTIRTGYSGEGAGLEEGVLMLREEAMPVSLCPRIWLSDCWVTDKGYRHVPPWCMKCGYGMFNNKAGMKNLAQSL